MESEPLKLDLRILAVRPGVAVVHRGEQGIVRWGVWRGVCRGVCSGEKPFRDAGVCRGDRPLQSKIKCGYFSLVVLK